MNREIDSAQEKSEATFCASLLLALAANSWNHAHIFVIIRWNVCIERGGGSGKRRRLGARVLNVCILEWPDDAPLACWLCLLLPTTRQWLSGLAIAARSNFFTNYMQINRILNR